jgi:ElaB/YqjD/DUF883 family membrane-anchored ribosome-binding protein
MADNKDIVINLKLNTKDTTANLNAVEKTVDNLNDTLNDLGKTTEKSMGDLGDTINNSAEEIKNLNDETAKAGKAQENLGDSAKKGSKGFEMINTATKAIGTSLKAMGIGAVIGLLMMLWEAVKKNQKVMDAINTVIEAIGIVFNALTDALIKAFTTVKEGTGSFEHMQKVIGALITLSINPLKLAFYAIKAAVLAFQLGWEQAFGKNNAEKIKSLKKDIADTAVEIKNTMVSSVEAGITVAQNISGAVSEVGALVKEVSKNVSGAIKDMNIKSVMSTADMITQGKKKIEELDILLKRQMLTSQKNAELQRQIRDDVNKSFDERIKANDELGKILDDQMQKEMGLLNKKIEIAKLELSTNKDNHDLQLALMNLENERVDIEERLTGQRSEQLANRTALEKEQAQKAIDQAKADQDLLLSIYQKTAEEKLRIDADTLLKQIELSTLSEQQKADAKMEVEKNYNLAIAEIEKTKNDAALEEAKKNADLLNKIYADSEEEKLQLAKDAAILEVEQSTLTAQQKQDAVFEIEKQFLDDKEALIEEANQKEIEEEEKKQAKKVEIIKAALAVFSQIAGVFGEILNQGQQNQLDKLDEQYQNDLDNFTGTEEEKEKLTKEYNKKKAMMEYDMAKAKKVQAIIDATIGTAVAVAAALPNIPLSILAGVLGVAQIGIIASQQVPKPKYKFGGVISGPSHSSGGVDINAEGGEGVINNVSMANPNLRNMASYANEAGGGVGFGNGQGIELGPNSIASIVNGINSKDVILSLVELNRKNEQLKIMQNEASI